MLFFFFQAEDGIRDLVRSRGLGDVYKRQPSARPGGRRQALRVLSPPLPGDHAGEGALGALGGCLLYTSDAADERSSVDLGGRRIIKKKKKLTLSHSANMLDNTHNSMHREPHKSEH